MWDPAHLHFDWDRDVAFDLLCRLAGILRRDIDKRWHWIGIGLDIEMEKADDPGAEYDQHQQQHQHSLPKGKGNRSVHCNPSVVAGGAIDKQRPAGDDLLAIRQPGGNLDHSISNPTSADRSSHNRSVSRYPDARRVAFIDYGTLRHRWSGFLLTGDNAEIGEHSGL